jgi:hypothetical protein
MWTFNVKNLQKFDAVSSCRLDVTEITEAEAYELYAQALKDAQRAARHLVIARHLVTKIQEIVSNGGGCVDITLPKNED